LFQGKDALWSFDAFLEIYYFLEQCYPEAGSIEHTSDGNAEKVRELWMVRKEPMTSSG
jgi:hypothetical protein